MTQLNYFQRKILKAGSVQLHDGLNVLVGGNGSGKSSFLEAIFLKYLEDKNTKIIAFSSGQNQNYEEDYIRILEKQRTLLNKGEVVQLNSFYFDINWAPLLLSTALFLRGTEKSTDENGLTKYEPKGLAANFMLQKGYSLNDITFSMAVPKFYLDLVNKNKLFAATDFVKMIDVILDIDSVNETKPQKEKKISIEKIDPTTTGELLSPIVGNNLLLSLEKIFQEIDGENNLEKAIRFLNFFQICSIDNSYLDLKNFSASVKKDEDFFMHNKLSDGEYQLLITYSILDIFNNHYEYLILDEVDSHIHVSNLVKLWDALSNTTKSKVITSTHNPISLKNISPDRVLSLTFGNIDNGLASLVQLDHMFDSRQHTSKTVALCFKNMETLVLIDGLKDWIILTSLFKKTKGASYDVCFDQLKPYALSSTRYNIHDLQDDKDRFVELIKNTYLSDLNQDQQNSIKLKNIICLKDRDNTSLQGAYGALGSMNLVKNETLIILNQRKKIKVTEIFLNRREIENYLLSPTLIANLDSSGEDLPYILNGVGDEVALGDILFSFDNEEAIATLDCKDMISKFIINNDDLDGSKGFSSKKLNELLVSFPKEEVSEYIPILHDFLSSILR